MSIFASIRNFFTNRVFKHVTSKVIIWVVTVICVAGILFQYFSREDSVSVLTIVGAVVVPFQEGINEAGGFLFKTETNRKNLADANARISELENENIDLQQQIDSLNALAIENAELRGLLNAKERLSDYDMVEAEIIGNDGINCFERFTINLGTTDGIKEGMNVINADGLVGIVTTVGLNYAIVTSIIEDGTNVSVMTKNGHQNCIATGDISNSGSGRMLLDNVLLDVDTSSDNTLITSDISDRFLPDLTVGYASDMTENADHLTKSGYLTTAVDFTRLKSVLVITTMKETLQEAENE